VSFVDFYRPDLTLPGGPVRHSDSITVLRAPLIPGPYGGQDRDWANAVSHVEPAARVRQLNTTEDVVNAERVITRAKAILFPTADIEVTDRVLWRGETWEVEGLPNPVNDGAGRVHHITVLLSWVRG
jgi:hypothetical protein